jgi:hypothetical protein
MRNSEGKSAENHYYFFSGHAARFNGVTPDYRTGGYRYELPSGYSYRT